MIFDQVVTAIALFLGPAGIWFGWWLSTQSESRRAQTSHRRQQQNDEQRPVVDTLRLLRQVSGELRNLGHGAYLGAQHSEQFTHTTRSFNEAWRLLGLLVTEASIAGPYWLEPACQPIIDLGRETMKTVQRMQQGPLPADIKAAQEQIRELDESVDDLVRTARNRLSRTLEEGTL